MKISNPLIAELEIVFDFPTKEKSILFKDIPVGCFMGYFGGAANNEVLFIKNTNYTYQPQIGSILANSNYKDLLVYSYRPVNVVMTVSDKAAER